MSRPIPRISERLPAQRATAQTATAAPAPQALAIGTRPPGPVMATAVRPAPQPPAPLAAAPLTPREPLPQPPSALAVGTESHVHLAPRVARGTEAPDVHGRAADKAAVAQPRQGSASFLTPRRSMTHRAEPAPTRRSGAMSVPPAPPPARTRQAAAFVAPTTTVMAALPAAVIEVEDVPDTVVEELPGTITARATTTPPPVPAARSTPPPPPSPYASFLPPWSTQTELPTFGFPAAAIAPQPAASYDPGRVDLVQPMMAPPEPAWPAFPVGDPAMNGYPAMAFGAPDPTDVDLRPNGFWYRLFGRKKR